MLLMKGKVPRILELADKIAEDIRKKKLKPGDPYQGTTETAEMLGVSTTAANRAMQVLVKRRIIERRQKKGTFVAVPTGTTPASPLRRVHLIVHENYLRTEGLLSDGIIVGMHDELPAAQVQFNFVPAENDAPQITELISEAMRSGKTEGFVLVRSSLPAQRLIAASGLPTVVHGSLHWSIPQMPWIDRDHRTGGALMTKHLLDQGFSRIAVLMRDRMFRGDHDLVDSIRESCAAAQLDLSSLTLRCLPADANAVSATVGELLSQHPNQRLGVICRSEPLALGAENASRELRLEMGKDVGIVVSDVYRKGSDSPPHWPYLRPALSPEHIGQHIGRMLAQQALNKAVEPDHEVIPVFLETASAGRSK
jgi:DNA-binding LacI/PurR family transcriptional regulator